MIISKVRGVEVDVNGVRVEESKQKRRDQNPRPLVREIAVRLRRVRGAKAQRAQQQQLLLPGSTRRPPFRRSPRPPQPPHSLKGMSASSRAISRWQRAPGHAHLRQVGLRGARARHRHHGSGHCVCVALRGGWYVVREWRLRVSSIYDIDRGLEMAATGLAWGAFEGRSLKRSGLLDCCGVRAPLLGDKSMDKACLV